MSLTPQQIETYYDQGYLIVDDVLTPTDLNPLIEEYQGIIDQRAQRYRAEGRLTSLYKDEPFDRRIMLLAAEVLEIVNELNPMYTRGRAAFDFLRQPKILLLIESLVGPEILCHPTQQLRPRIPDHVTGQHRYSGSYSGWHQDAAVLRPDADNHLLVTVWVPLTPAAVENGCLVVLPGSHKHGLRRHQTNPTPPPLFIPDEELPRIEPRPLPIEPGSLILVHNYLCHASLPNRSQRVRWSFDFRYQDSRNPSGHYQPGFVVRSEADPQSVVQDHQQWADMWARALAKGPQPPPWRWQ